MNKCSPTSYFSSTVEVDVTGSTMEGSPVVGKPQESNSLHTISSWKRASVLNPSFDSLKGDPLKNHRQPASSI